MDQGLDAARIVIAVETRIYQEGIRHMLDGLRKANAVALASNESQVLKACVECSPDILLLDAMMPNALGITRQVKQQYPEIKLIVLAMSTCRQAMITFAGEGVQEFLTREDSLNDLCHCIDAAMSDGFWCSGHVAQLLLQNSTAFSRSSSLDAESSNQEIRSIDSLTPQQVKVLHYIESGLSNKAIARQLNIETATVKNHVHHILRKLGVNTRGEAAATLRRESYRAEMPYPA